MAINSALLKCFPGYSSFYSPFGYRNTLLICSNLSLPSHPYIFYENLCNLYFTFCALALISKYSSISTSAISQGASLYHLGNF